MRHAITILILLLALSGIASAQSYSIRVTNNTSLRESYSLTSRRVETVPAGTTLQVVGSFNRWLKINRGGGEAWMASWVSHSRVEGQAVPVNAVSADIDNCCFVDRQCRSDPEWQAGYWAFQNNECAAPTQTLSSVSTPATSVAADQVNNCCFIGWQCNSGQDWEQGFHAYQENRCEHRGLAIEGSAKFVAEIEVALNLLKSTSSYWYQYAITALDKIKEHSDSYLRGSTFYLTIEHVYGDAAWLAGVIIHDACHWHRSNAGLFRYDTLEQQIFEESLCLEIQLEALATLLPGDPNPFGLRTLLENLEDPAHQWWN